MKPFENKVVIVTGGAIVLLMLFLLAAYTYSGTGNDNSNTGDTRGPQTTVTEKNDSPKDEQREEETPTNSKNTNILVAYFSRVGISSFSEDIDAVSSASLRVGDEGLIGNTKVIADMIQIAVGGDLFQIVTAKTYPEDQGKTSDIALEELRDNTRPELVTHVENMDDYDVIFLGYPNWWGTMPMAVFTFLEEYDFSGKTIIPFCTHEGSRLGRSVEDITSLCPQSTILDGFAIRGANVVDAQDDVTAWLQNSEMIE
jgi:flavodoxin